MHLYADFANPVYGPALPSHLVYNSFCIALGRFKGGDLWVENPDGTIFKKLKSGASVAGKVMKHQGRLNVFDPKKHHAVEKYEGERWLSRHSLQDRPRISPMGNGITSRVSVSACRAML